MIPKLAYLFEATLMKSRSQLSLQVFSLLTLIFVLGCGEVETKEPENAEVVAMEVNTEVDSDAAERADDGAEKISIEGSWKIDIEESINANSALLSRPGIDAAAFKRTIRGTILDFEIFDDNTFDCFEVVEEVESDYSGVWELKGNKVKLLQKTMNGEEEEDELVGTATNDRMDVVHAQNGFSMKFVLIRNE